MESKITDEVKVFLKIKEIEQGESKFYKINQIKQNFTLFDQIRKIDSDKSILFDLDKIFTNEENAYIYEEICRDTVSEALNGQNFCFVSYGLSHTGKKSTLIGGEDSLTNINTRGLLFRQIESLLNQIQDKDLTLSLSFVSIYSNKYIDLTNFIGNIPLNISEKDILSQYKDIKATTMDPSNLFKRTPITDLNETIHFISKILTMFYKLEAYEKKLFSRSHFVLFLNLFNSNGNLISTLSFCALAGSEKITKTNQSDLARTRDAIYIQNSFSNFIGMMTSLMDKQKNNKYFNYQDSTLTFCLKNVVQNCKFRICGYIYPGTGYYDSVKDTLMFLFKCQKSQYDGSSGKKELKSPEVKRDEVIYELENKIKAQEKTIIKQNETIGELNKKFENAEQQYKKSLDVVKDAFNFEGDIKKLMINDEHSKEARFAKSIRESCETVKYLKKRIGELELKIESLKEENKRLELQKRVIESDKAMVNIYKRLQEDNILEEKKLKHLLEHNKDVDQLRIENRNLKSQVEAYRNAIEEKNKMIHNLPNLLKENVNKNKENFKNSEEIEKNLKKSYNSEFKMLKETFKKDNELNKQKFESIIQQKNEEIVKLKDEVKSAYQQNGDLITSYKNELYSLWKNIDKFLNVYKNQFDSKKINKNTFSMGIFSKAKEEIDKNFEEVNLSLNKLTFPLLFDFINDINKSNNKTKKAFEIEKPLLFAKSTNSLAISETNLKYSNNFRDNLKKIGDFSDNPLILKEDLSLSASEISQDLKKVEPQKFYQIDDLNLEKNDLVSIVLDYQQRLKEYMRYFDDLKKFKRNEFKQKNNNVVTNKVLEKENEKLRNNLNDLRKINYNNKVTMISQERILNQHAQEKFLTNSNLKSRPVSSLSMVSRSIQNVRAKSSLKNRNLDLKDLTRPNTAFNLL